MATDRSEGFALILALRPTQVGIARTFVAGVWRALGYEDEAAEDARLAASEAFAELAARCGGGMATVSIDAVGTDLTTRLEVTARGDGEEDGPETDDRRRSLIAALMPRSDVELDRDLPFISFTVPWPM